MEPKDTFVWVWVKSYLPFYFEIDWVFSGWLEIDPERSPYSTRSDGEGFTKETERGSKWNIFMETEITSGVWWTSDLHGSRYLVIYEFISEIISKITKLHGVKWKGVHVLFYNRMQLLKYRHGGHVSIPRWHESSRDVN